MRTIKTEFLFGFFKNNAIAAMAYSRETLPNSNP
jgi:hypothetical protein